MIFRRKGVVSVLKMFFVKLIDEWLKNLKKCYWMEKKIVKWIWSNLENFKWNKFCRWCIIEEIVKYYYGIIKMIVEMYDFWL